MAFAKFKGNGLELTEKCVHAILVNLTASIVVYYFRVSFR